MAQIGWTLTDEQKQLDRLRQKWPLLQFNVTGAVDYAGNDYWRVGPRYLRARWFDRTIIEVPIAHTLRGAIRKLQFHLQLWQEASRR